MCKENKLCTGVQWHTEIRQIKSMLAQDTDAGNEYGCCGAVQHVWGSEMWQTCHKGMIKTGSSAKLRSWSRTKYYF